MLVGPAAAAKYIPRVSVGGSGLSRSGAGRDSGVKRELGANMCSTRPRNISNGPMKGRLRVCDELYCRRKGTRRPAFPLAQPPSRARWACSRLRSLFFPDAQRVLLVLGLAMWLAVTVEGDVVFSPGGLVSGLFTWALVSRLRCCPVVFVSVLFFMQRNFCSHTAELCM